MTKRENYVKYRRKLINNYTRSRNILNQYKIKNPFRDKKNNYKLLACLTKTRIYVVDCFNKCKCNFKKYL